MPYLPAICAYEGLKYITRLGIGNIQAHARPLIERLHKELPGLGLTSITPFDNPAPIASFISPEMDKIEDKLKRAFSHPAVSMSRWQKTGKDGKTENVRGMRIAVSVYNNHEDIDRFLNALDD